MLKGKRARLAIANGFISKFYDISEVVSPVLAWGFLGTDDRLRELCYYFKVSIDFNVCVSPKKICQQNE